jgi:hypothetical protein
MTVQNDSVALGYGLPTRGATRSFRTGICCPCRDSLVGTANIGPDRRMSVCCPLPRFPWDSDGILHMNEKGEWHHGPLLVCRSDGRTFLFFTSNILLLCGGFVWRAVWESIYNKVLSSCVGLLLLDAVGCHHVLHRQVDRDRRLPRRRAAPRAPAIHRHPSPACCLPAAPL